MIVRSLYRLTKRTTSNGLTFVENCSYYRPMSTVPLHLARANNGMVNVLVKSTKVPRPASILPLKKKETLNNSLTPVVPKKALPDHISYVGNARMPITSSLKIVTPDDDTPQGVWPVFRMMVRILLVVDFISF